MHVWVVVRQGSGFGSLLFHIGTATMKGERRQGGYAWMVTSSSGHYSETWWSPKRTSIDPGKVMREKEGAEDLLVGKEG